MVLIVGQNSVWQYTYRLPSLASGTVNRVAEVFTSAAGKGSNVARALGLLGKEARLLGYVGGPNGVKFASACREDGIQSDFCEIERETRVCTTLIEDSGRITEIVEPAPHISERERRAHHASFAKHLPSAHVLVISGTAMQGESEDCYLDFVRSAHAQGLPVVLDSYRDHGRRALEAAPEVLKVNGDELAELSRMSCATFEQRGRAAEQILSQSAVRWIIITRGKGGAEAFDGQQAFVASAPEIRLKNAIGSGDAFTAGVVGVLLDHMPSSNEIASEGSSSRVSAPLRSGFPWNADLAQALKVGTAMGTANCLNLKPGAILRDDYESVLSRVVVSAAST